MVEIFQFAFEFGPMVFLICLPLMACLWIAYRCSSWRRRLALVLAFMYGSVLAFQIYALLTKGSLLATLLVILMTPVVLVSILLLIVAEGIAKRVRSQERVIAAKDTQVAPNQENTAT